MPRRYLPLALALVAMLPACRDLPPPVVDPGRPLTTIAFGSCADQALEQPIWDAIRALDPDLFVLAGDAIYSQAEDRATLDADYAAFAAKPGFARLRRRVPLMAIWDDHDFGRNDGGADHRHKAMFERAFLDFFAVPAGSPRRTRPGLYHAAAFGPPGRRVQVILLDTRFFRSPLTYRPEGESLTHGRFLPDPDPQATLLGAAQWAWLAEVLRQPAEVRLLVSTIQLVANDHGWEKWGNLPHERRRLLGLIREQAAGGVVVLSGDRHLGELSRLPASDPEGVGYPLYDFTASGLTHSVSTDLPPEANRYRVGGEPYRDLNFGVVRIDWQRAVLTLELRDRHGALVRRHPVSMATLRPR